MIRKILIFGILVLFFDAIAIACSCVKGTIEEAYKNADIITLGKVIKLEKIFIPDSARIKILINMGTSIDKNDTRIPGLYLTKVSLKVLRIYKGENKQDTVTIYTGVGHGDCGFRFLNDKVYIIYGRIDNHYKSIIEISKFLQRDNSYWTNICTRTQEFNKDEEEALMKIK